MRSIATVCLSGTLEEKLAAAARAGFDGVEIFENDLIASPWSPSEIRARCADLGLSIELYQPFRDFEAVPPQVLATNLRRAERKFELMGELGADLLLVCSSVSPDALDDDDLAAEQLHALADRAAQHGIRIAYEALAWGRFVNTWEHSWRIVRAAGHPALGLCLDSFHVLSRTPDVTGIAEVPGRELFFVQLADAPHLDMDVLQWSRHHRLFPGQGAFDLTGFTNLVWRTGYQGPISLEVFNDVYRQADPGSTAVDAMRSLLDLQDRCAGGESSVLPAAAGLTATAFARLAVHHDSAVEVAESLAALGFTHHANHRTSPVRMWRQGAATLLVSSTATTPGGAEISGLGLESTDPAASARRAVALLAPQLSPDVGTGTTAVADPDGLSVAFCPQGDEWLTAFLPTVEAEDDGIGLTGIDHIALAQPFDRFDEVALFYRSVLGLRPRDDTEYAAPFGLVRSRSLGNGGVHLVLTRPLLRRGEWAPHVPDPQHIAFATDDIFATAKAFRARGGAALSIPDNYYDDLEARLALPEELLAELREFDLLYDRDEGGEFFHFSTPMIGSRVFFEVTQRVGGYRGIGSVNAPVRMAAHRSLRTTADSAPRGVSASGPDR
ncbi:sugar phosphate isomerase/epimerase and 4-hydroxyphenylpyruvate domain-containing protein [Lentzea nigeriaca]|uniref:sugar phosphate isomerase/epimerase and 4-hydroxyphenylpyruvate domain-containing protein n=1 Tax=Lentzea nigeriaca TaxID=1128665 RepID=UPI00195CEEA7|nr:sugar phosphate isomerase/epimerase and 4-hydroxyphenylpyruvate domain-containing protein [Lentzea nigeriaca]MBM7856387.1 4-hydroxyphenylpyruvate dioxygenase [Lentzea nigeriaca]